MSHTTQTQWIEFGDNNTNCSNTIGSYNTAVYKSEEDAQILRWRTPLEPENRHHSVRIDRLRGIGDWLGNKGVSRVEVREGEADKALCFMLRESGSGQNIFKVIGEMIL